MDFRVLDPSPQPWPARVKVSLPPRLSRGQKPRGQPGREKKKEKIKEKKENKNGKLLKRNPHSQRVETNEAGRGYP